MCHICVLALHMYQLCYFLNYKDKRIYLKEDKKLPLKVLRIFYGYEQKKTDTDY
jgi:hypothetical protein